MSTSWKMAALVGLCACLFGAPAYAQPANDTCADAEAIAVGATVTGTTVGATAETLPFCGTSDGIGGAVWYTVVGTGDTIIADLCASGFDTKVRVFEGGCGVLTCVGGNDDSFANCGSGGRSYFTWASTAATTYHILVHGFNSSEGAYEMSLSGPTLEDCFDGIDNDLDGDTDCADSDCALEPSCAPPANDDCASAIALTDGVAEPFDTSNATGSVPFTSCAVGGSVSIGKPVWFTFAAPGPGTLTLSTCSDASFDTEIGAFDACGGACLARNDDAAGCTGSTSEISFTVPAAATITIAVGHFSSTSTTGGPGNLTATFTPAAVEDCTNGIDDDADGLIDCDDVVDCGTELACLGPANDNCIDATAVAEGTFPVDTTNSSLDGPTDGDSNMGNDVWFLYTATDSGTATIETCGTFGSMDDSVIIVYGDTCPIAGDVGIASDDDGCTTPNFSSTVTIDVCAGSSYLVQVGGWNGAEGTSDLTITNTPGAPANDDCVNAIAVSEGITPFANCGAILDGPNNEVGANMDTDVWFLYTAAGDGIAEISTCGAPGTLDDTVLVVYDGAACPLPTDLGLAEDDDGCTSPNFNSIVSIPVTTGSTYLIQVGGWNGAEGDSALTISFPEICDDGIDNDADGLIDCADTADCAAAANCLEAGNCADGIDNDLDGLTDCLDVDDCALDVICDGLPPANDNCLDAIAVGEGTVAFENLDATLDGPNEEIGNNMGTDVWYLYTAGNTGTATIDTCAGPAGSLTDTVIIVYDAALGCPIAGDLGLASDDDGCAAGGAGAAFASTVSLPVVAGDQLLVQVGGWNGLTGTANLTIGLEVAGDDCADAIAVGEGSFDFNNTATTSVGPDECDPGANTGTDLWFLYTPTLSGEATINTCTTTGTLTDTVLTVYDGATGCPVPGDVALACDDDSCAAGGAGAAFASEVVIPVTLGNTYYVQVGGWNGAEGTGTLLIDTVVLCVDPIPSFSAGPALSGIAPLTVDFLNTSDNGGDATTTYDWDFGDTATSTDESPSHTYTDCGTFDVTLTANGCGVSVPTTTAGLITTYAMGDTNGDCAVDVADAVNVANYLFGGGAAPVCGNAADVNGDGVVDIADPVYLLIFLFGGGAAPVAPAGPAC